MKTAHFFSLSAAFAALALTLFLSSCGTMGDGGGNSSDSGGWAEPSSSSTPPPLPPPPSSAYIPPSSSSSSSRQQSSGSQEQIVFCEHLKNQSGSVIRVCEETSLGVCNLLANVGQIVSSCRYEYMTDSRNGNSYRTIKIGNQTWMAENLNYYVAGSVCYDNNSANCTENGIPKYGRLYDWATAKTVCPFGWHLPTGAEWVTLVNYAGGEPTAYTKLKAKSGWNGINSNGTDDYGFAALPGGGYKGSFFNVGYSAVWWTSAEYDNDGFTYIIDLVTNGLGSDSKTSLYSVRCVKN
ncbi:MAG: fibrobacter succinogenes major paralogous domain-containing protein [Fibromonadaceae bacterium]|jgi:uncharacterized protein (TIGR02145 family)|nr:fibrobacter succinogenes major paralogous domain-containing protein [Fibromonadaceae bacterium]